MLVTGRRLEHYNAGTMTRRTGNLDLVPSDWLELHPDDAARLWVTDGDLVSRCAAPYGRIELPARVTERIEPGHVFTAFHFPEIRTNLLDRLVGRRQHVVPGVQGRRGRRAAGRRAGEPHAGDRVGDVSA